METIDMSGWVSLLGSLAVIGIVVVALTLMVGAQKPGDAAKRVGAILGIMVLLILLPQLVVSAWHELPIWQKLCIVTGCFIGWRLRQTVNRPRNRRRE